MLKIISASHLDHGLTPEHVEWLRETFADKEAFFVSSLTIPDHLPEVECALYGPTVGDPPVAEIDVRYVVRGNRSCASRVLRDPRPRRKTRQLTVIAGPMGDDPCVLYTAYGGPPAPREPGDLSLADWALIVDSRAFWATHALAVEGV